MLGIKTALFFLYTSRLAIAWLPKPAEVQTLIAFTALIAACNSL
jgi:hypothetical protein